jgi:hypothetical protein
MFNFLKKYDIFEDDISVYEEIELLNKKITSLETENIELTNSIYELENKIDMILDKINPRSYDLSKFSLGES